MYSIKMQPFVTGLLAASIIFAALDYIALGGETASGIVSLVSANRLREHMTFLGSDELEGRGTGTEGGQEAARYISNYLGNLGLVPLGDNSTYFQDVQMRGSIPLEESRLTLIQGEESVSLRLTEDYLLYHMGAETFIPNPVPMVFAGYGIVAPEFDHNDYQNLDVRGKVVVFIAGEPESNDRGYFKGSELTVHSCPEAKHRVAISRGARGSILIPKFTPQGGRNWDYWVHEFAFEHVTLAYGTVGNLSVLVNPDSARILFKGAKHSFDEVFEMAQLGETSGFELKARVSFRGRFRQREFVSHNVVGLLPGKHGKLNDTFLLISAHYDHLGVGPEKRGDSVYNGVFDNASGVAAVMELARVWKQELEAPDRSVVFLFTTGEEKGLLGAYFYTEHPAVPLYRTIANINVDGLALFAEFDDVIGVGAELSGLEMFLQDTAAELGLTVSSLPSQFSGSKAFTRSDQAAFADSGIPSMLLLEGLGHRGSSKNQALLRVLNWSEKYYHSPFDDLNQPIDYLAAQQHCGVILLLSHKIANSPSPPEWKEGVPYVHARLQTKAERR
jgi:hypothetical protein